MVKKNKKYPFLSGKHIIIFSVCLVVVISSGIYLNLCVKKMLPKLIKDTINKSSSHLYHIDFKNIQTNILTGTIHLSGVILKLDTLTYKTMMEQKILPKYTIALKADQLELNHISFLKAYLRRSVDIQSILIDNPILEIARQALSSSECATPDQRTVYQQISKHCKSVHIEEITIQDLTIHYTNQLTEKDNSTTIKNADININDLLIDSLSQYDRTRFHYAKDISVNVQHYQYETDNKLYTIKLDEIAASTSKQEAKITGLHVIPKYPEMEFSALFKEQKDRYEITAEKIALNKIDYHLLSTAKCLSASTLDISGANADIFRNREMPHPSDDCAKNYPSLALQRLSLDTQIDTVKWTSSKISYSEYNPKSQRIGTVFFDQVGGKLTHVTNNPNALQRNRFCDAVATGLIMERGQLNVKFHFDLLDPKGAFIFSGTLGQMNARALNPVLKPLALIKMRKGFIERIDFSGAGNTEACSGNLSARYNQLRIDILKKDLMDPKLKRRTLASIYTNMLLIRSENPNHNGTLHSSNFLYKRPIYASFFNIIWKSLAIGLMDNIGLGAAAKKQMENLSIHLQKQKLEHQIRRMNRIRHREERHSVRDSLKLKTGSTF